MHCMPRAISSESVNNPCSAEVPAPMRFLIALLPLALLVSCAAALPLPRDTVGSELAPLNSSDPNPVCIGRCPWCDLLKQ